MSAQAFPELILGPNIYFSIVLRCSQMTFFIRLNKTYPNSYFLVITKNWDQKKQYLLESKISKEFIKKIIFKSAKRDEVPSFLGISDIMLSFRKNSFSQKACCPTKMGEAFACGIPVIANKDVGDVNNIIKKLNGGEIVDLENHKGIENLINNIQSIKDKGGNELRKKSKNILGLDKGIDQYRKVYERL